jgi:DNA-binding GntR family transcriptional regulator
VKERWHTYICEIAQNSVAENLLSRLTLRTAQLRNRSVVRKERQKQSIIELHTLMNAIKDRDADAAADAAQRHVMSASASALMPAKTE